MQNKTNADETERPFQAEPFDELLDLSWRRGFPNFTEEESNRLAMLEAGSHEALLSEIWKKKNVDHARLSIYEALYLSEHPDWPPEYEGWPERIEASCVSG